MLSLKSLNEITVKPVKLDKIDVSRVKGGEMFSELYANIFICARKKSGKTTVIFNILKHCANKNTKIIIFASTVNKDKTYKAINDYFSGKGNVVLTYTSLKEEGVDVLDQIVTALREPESEEEDEQEGPSFITLNDGRENKAIHKRSTSRYIAPELIFVFDDLNTELRAQSISMLLKSNRHYRCKVILSSQYIHDLQPASLLQLDYMLVFKGQSHEKLELIHNRLDLSTPVEIFKAMYHLATRANYSFFYVDKNNEQYRINFNKEIIYSDNFLSA